MLSVSIIAICAKEQDSSIVASAPGLLQSTQDRVVRGDDDLHEQWTQCEHYGQSIGHEHTKLRQTNARPRQGFDGPNCGGHLWQLHKRPWVLSRHEARGPKEVIVDQVSSKAVPSHEHEA